jgi:hypothetical protein
LNLPLFFGPKAVSEILGVSSNEVNTLLRLGRLNGGKTVNGLKISCESVCLFLGEKELRKKSYLWAKDGGNGNGKNQYEEKENQGVFKKSGPGAKKGQRRIEGEERE